MARDKITIETKGVVEPEATEEAGETTPSKSGGGRFHAPFIGSHVVSPVEKNWVRVGGRGWKLREHMGSSCIVDDDKCKLQEIDGDQVTSGRIFLGNGEKLNGFLLDFRGPVNVPPKFKVKRVTTSSK